MFQIVIVDQESTHGTFVNSEKLMPFIAKEISNGDCITLGTFLEAMGRNKSTTTATEHLATELEVGIQQVQIPIDQQVLLAAAGEDKTRPTTNSFHAPQDSESESDGNEDEEEPTLRPWRPFTKDNDVVMQSTPNIEIVESFAREHSSSTSINGGHGPATQQQQQQQQLPHPIIDLTMNDNAWAGNNQPRPTHTDYIEAFSDHDELEEDDYDEDIYEDDDYYEEYDDHDEDVDENDSEGFCENEDHGHGADYFPYEYDTEDKHSVNNGETQILAEPRLLPGFHEAMERILPTFVSSPLPSLTE